MKRQRGRQIQRDRDMKRQRGRQIQRDKDRDTDIVR